MLRSAFAVLTIRAVLQIFIKLPVTLVPYDATSIAKGLKEAKCIQWHNIFGFVHAHS